MLDNEGHYKITERPFRGESIRSRTGKLANSELKSLSDFIMQDQHFFTLSRDLSNHEITDASRESLKVQCHLFEYKTEGYGIKNKRFRKIIDEIYHYFQIE
jgi:hypothetical protein